MNDAVMDLLMDRMDSRRGSRMSRRDGRDMTDHREYHETREHNPRRHYDDGYEDGYADGRRGVKGTGPYGRRDRMDGHESPLRLSKEDLREWKRMLENADGTRGAHYDMSQIMATADKLGIQFNDFSEAEFCMTVNMLYSDYCHTVKNYIPPRESS